jgi:hypothetical protein
VKEFQPHSQRQNETEITIGQAEGAPFKKGVFNDIPGLSVPRNAVSDSAGYIPFEDRMQAAPGCRIWSSTTPPPLPDRTGYSFTKTGKRITKTIGEDFSEADEGNYIVHDDGKHELIETYINANQVDVETTTVHAASSAGWVRGQINGRSEKPIAGKYLLHIDTRLFVFDAEITEYTRCYCISYRDLLNSHSVIDSEGETAVIFNAGGIFRINLAVDSGYLYWKINTPVPRTLLTGVARSITNVYGYKYTYGCARIAGDAIDRDRLTEDLEHETGTCLPSTTDYKDYAEVWGTRPVGDASTSYSVLTGAAIDSSYETADKWSPISNGQWTSSINGVSTNFSADFTGVRTMSEVAQRMQIEMQNTNSKITCRFSSEAFLHFIFTTMEEGGTIGYISAGSGGTDIGSYIMGCDSGVATITYPTFTEKLTIGTLYCPADLIEAAIFQRHHTHYPVWRSLDIGEHGIDPLTGEGNNEEQFIWHSDVPIAKSFVASRSGYTITASEGTFQPMDEGAKLRFQDGTEITLNTYYSPTEMMSSDSGSIDGQAAAIGGDESLGKAIRVMTASQVGTTVVRTAGTTFSAADVGKTIFWPIGLRSHIIAYVDENTVTVSETNTIVSTGACIDPKCRNFCDNISDDTLRSRITNFSLQHRLWQELPDCDTGALMSGWIFAGVRETKIAYYGQVTQEKEHLIGYYYPARQYLKYKDEILAFSAFPDSMTVYCSRSTTVHPTNTFINYSINKIQSVFLISGQTVADEQRGLWEFSSFLKLPDGIDVCITNEPRLRYFDGRSFSDDIADKRYTKTLEKLERPVALLYEQTHGLSIYGRKV